MSTISRLTTVLAAVLGLALGGADGLAGVRGRALLTDAPSRVKPGNLFLCTINGDERKLEKLVEGPVVDAHFSPDGKQAVYGMGGKVMVVDLATKSSREVGAYVTELTYFNWGLDDKVYFSDGQDAKKDPVEIFCLDLKTKEKKAIHKGTAGRSTVSNDGRRVAWVMPPVCAEVGGKQYRYMGGCGGSISPSGKYLTSNLTTTHKIMGIFEFGADGPSAQPVATVTGLKNYAINGFSFGRSDDWVCYTVEHPENVSPIAYIAYWRTDDHVEVAQKHVIKDFFDESDAIPAGAELEKIVVCAEGPTETPLASAMVNAGASRPLRVVGHFRTKDGPVTAALREGVTWKTDAAKLALTATEFKGVAESGPVTATAECRGKTASFSVTVLPPLTGDGFKAEFFGDATFTKSALVRVDRYINYRWDGSASPDPAVNGKAPWSARWTGAIDIPADGEYTFAIQLGEGSDGSMKTEGGEKRPRTAVWVNDAPLVWTKTGGYPWIAPRAGQPVALKKGRCQIKVEVVDASTHPVVAQLYWSGPGIKQSLLGGGYVHSGAGAAPGKPKE